ncbi:MAG: NUDIX hydrolase, partial [Marivirga sp.]|nr:NUDIX hydrolase [Marivirga sp.]
MAEKLKKYFKSPEKRDVIAQVSINCVIFGFHEKTLKVIVNEISLGSKPFVVLPGGFVGKQENVSDAVERIVKESTG